MSDLFAKQHLWIIGAASDLLEGLSMYGGEKSAYGKYAQQASTYLNSYEQSHGGAKPPTGKLSTILYCQHDTLIQIQHEYMELQEMNGTDYEEPFDQVHSMRVCFEF